MTTSPAASSAGLRRAISGSRRPGLVVTGGALAPAAFVIVARWAIALGRAGHVRDVGLQPRHLRNGDRRIRGVMEPGVPFGRDRAGVVPARENDPAARPRPATT